MSETPIWFNDVDGPINVFPADPPDNLLRGWNEFKASPNCWRGMTDQDREDMKWVHGGTHQYRIMYDPTIIERMKQMHEDKIVELVWLTSWGYGANGELGEGLGLPRLESAGEPTFRMSGLAHTTEGGRWWKWNCAKSYLRAHSDVEKFVWTDDHFAFEHDALKWATKHGGLPIVIDESIGITHEHLDLIATYLKSDVHLTDSGIR